MKRRALLIDPWKQIIKEIAVEGNLLEALYKIIGCDCVEPHPFPDGSKNDIWIDESGFLQEPVPACFSLSGSDQPLAGRGVVLGRAGSKTVSTALKQEDVERLVHWEIWEDRIDPRDANPSDII
jgi:hypothetical protein